MGRELDLVLILLCSESASPQELTVTDLTSFDCESGYDDYIICIPDSALACLHSTENTPLKILPEISQVSREMEIYHESISWILKKDFRSKILSLKI